MNNRKVFILFGPSASGKTMVLQYLLQKKELNLGRIITTTTRKPRTHELHSKDYYFITPEEFRRKNNWIEQTEYPKGSGIFYGTEDSEIKRINQLNKDAIVILDANGVHSFKKFYGPERVVSIFIYRDLEEINKALNDRNLPKEEIQKRLLSAELELSNSSFADYVVYNNRDKKALVEQVVAIIKNEQKK